MKTLLRTLICAPIALYRYAVSPVLGTHCRFTPSCSCYAQEAVERHGLAGVALALWRIARCQPFARAGFDPVPAQLTFSMKDR